MEEQSMCRTRKLVVINKLGLGTRELGYEVYSLPKGEVLEFTAKQLRDIIKNYKEGKDEVYGLKIAENGFDLVFDEKFFTTNMMYKVHIGSLTPMAEMDCLVNLFYIVIGTHVQHGEVMYNVISSRFERTAFNEDKLMTLLEMGVITGGAKLDENGNIVVAPLEKVKSLEKENTLEKKKVTVEEKPLEEKKVVVEMKSLEKEVPAVEVKPLEKEVPVEKEKSSEKEISVPVAKKEPEKVSKVEEKKKA